MRRPSTTTSALREQFPEEYASLEQSSDLVVSVAQCFSWAGGYGQLFGGASLLQKLPYRTYVGIKKTKSRRIDYISARVYSPISAQFQPMPLGHFIDTDVTGTFLSYILPLFPSPDTWEGYEIRLLSESDWTDVVPCFVAIASAFALLSGLLSPDFFRQISTTPSAALLEEAETKEQIGILWRIASLMENNYTYTPSIAEVASTLISSRLPVVAETADLSRFLTPMGTFQISPKSLISMDLPPWLIHRFDHEGSSHLPMPVEWGLVSTGAHRMRSLHFPYTKAMPDFGDLDGLASHLHQADGSQHKTTHDPDWFRRKIDVLHFYTMAVIDTFKRSLTTRDANPFLHALHAMHEISHLLQHHTLDHVTAPGSEPFKNFLKQHLRGNYAYLVTEKGMRGLSKIFFAAPKHVLSGHEQELEKLYPDMSGRAFEYLSWKDDFGNDGLRIEYARPFFSPELSQETFRDLSHREPDIFIDCERKKIHIGGKKLTSNDLRSQHFTCLLLHELFQSNKRRIALHTLPRISYTDSANELYQKVLSPLEKAVQKYSGSTCPLHIEHIENELWISAEESTCTIAFSHQNRPRAKCHKTEEVQPHLLATPQQTPTLNKSV
ncbi:hypothetical protein COW46_05270 [Candidatus Gracilibacteria bacterium CG17_big_fil_post_rev_8_21_14_2_50_48_13]|nr:MAG: hypothetical protein COW46_05270 [Candidatus Gracilibacteria bacterium CG17_big_fil_post_rev_8_21_14_2_50_48_13]